MARGKEVEDTISSQLAALLKDKKLNAEFKGSFQTAEGRKEPDIVIRTADGLVLLEAKVPPAALPQAMSEAVEYKETVGQTEQVIGIFGVVYAAGGKKFIDAWYSGQGGVDFEKLKDLKALADWILEKLKSKKPVSAISTQKVIAILNESVTLINELLLEIPKEDLENIFGGREFFSTVLDYEQESNVADEALRYAAAYLLLNQILFYTILSRETGKYPPLNVKGIKDGKDLQEQYFDIVLGKDYKAVFEFNVAKFINHKESLQNLKAVISAVQLLSPESLNHDLLGKIFHNLIPLSLRKVVAAYYTNSEAAEILANLAVENADDKVIDPACGSGTLLVAAYNKKKELSSKFTESAHVKFLEHDIFGVDIMPFAAHLAAVSLALREPLNFTNKVNIAINDSTTLSPGATIEPAQYVIKGSYTPKLSVFTEEATGKEPQKKKIKKGAIDLLDEQRPLTLPHFDVVIMNPPFTKFQRLPQEYKQKLFSRFSTQPYRELVHGQLGLHGYFLLLADKLLKEGGRLAAVLPVTTISLEGFYGLISLFLHDYQIEHIIVSSGRSAFSENTSLREMLFVAKKMKPTAQTKTKFTFIHASPKELTIDKAREIARKLREFGGEDEDNDDFYIRQIAQASFIKNIRSLYQTLTLHSSVLIKIDSKLNSLFKPGQKFQTLGAVSQREKWKVSENPRGVEKIGYYPLSLLSKNNEILKEHDVWLIQEESANNLKVMHRFNKTIFKIPRNCVAPQFRRFAGRETIKIAEPYDYIITQKFDGLNDFLEASALADENLKNSINRNFREGEWQKFITKNSAYLFCFYRGNITVKGSKLMASYDHTPQFAGPGGSWVFQVPQESARIAALWLNTTMAFYYILRDRKETEGGFIELDKYVFDAIPFPIAENVSSQKLNELERELSRVKFPSLLEQFQKKFGARRKLDLFFLEYAGMRSVEANRFLDLLYDTLAAELLRLRNVMGK